MRNFTKIVKKPNPNQLSKQRKEIRYLVELRTPAVSLDYLHHKVHKKLSVIDINHLLLTKFRQWKTFLIRTHFRMELNVSEPIPRKVNTLEQAENYVIEQNEILDERDEDFTETSSEYNDYTNKFPPSKDELLHLQHTQTKVELWFE